LPTIPRRAGGSKAILRRHSGGKKKAIVICMSRLVLVMWHLAREAQHEMERLAA